MAVYCQQWTLVKDDGDERVCVPLDCHSWACSHCGPAMKRRLKRAVAAQSVHSLLTLTANASLYPDPRDAWASLSAAINPFFKRIRRHARGRPVDFFLVWETTARGYPHAHILLRAPFLSQRWLSHAWADLTGSFIVDIRRVSSGPAAAHYIAKYLAKQLDAPKGTRRYRHSALFFGGPSLTSILRPSQPGLWRVLKRSIGELALELAFAGWHVSHPRDGPLRASRACPASCHCAYTLLSQPGRP